ncbi:Gldg family protein [Gloeocapsopsis crepidinum LEGE 06123]|uniref:Gldg family protein n=1 Tax=Gloeocapsopsis crepidinum LEGE 06123 TaxID=588587 RepID=A0ABR9URY9_9CHRO|nr:Gldg family protein [Gloeocapsopsis crepidinum]MBE9191052.1 Gldg family protein [Gloeocapsopsis crepidinum LEGE 06123]
MKSIARRNYKYWKYLFWLGPVLFVAGLTAGLVSNDWEPVPLGLLIAGVVITGLWLIFSANQNRWWSRRSTQAGTNALIATLSVLALLGLINFLAVRYPVRRDFTEAQLFTLAPQSQQLVRNLSQPVNVWIFDRNQDQQDRELLENYRRQNPQFSFEYVDPQVQRGLAEKFGVKQFGEVHLEAGQQRRLVQVVNNEQRLSEVRLTNSIQQVISDRTAKVYFLQGHGELPVTSEQGGLSQALTALGDRSYTTEPLNLIQNPTIPQDATMIVVASPKQALFPPEVKALTDYLNSGGSLLLMTDPNTNPGLDSLLKSWGVTLDDRIVIDPAGASIGFGPAVPVVDTYGEHPITQDFNNGISFYSEARSLELSEVAGVQATPLLITSPQTWAESNLQGDQLQFNPETDVQGPLTIGAALSRQVNNQASQEARLVIFGDSNFAVDGLFEQQLNGDVFLNSVGWLSKQDEETLSIRPREPRNRRINLAAQQANVLGLTALLLIPLIGFASAVFLWWRRR